MVEEVESKRDMLEDVCEAMKMEKGILAADMEEYLEAQTEADGDFKGLDFESILDFLKDEYKLEVNKGRWPAASAPVDSKAAPPAFGAASVHLAAGCCQPTNLGANALVQNLTHVGAKRAGPKGAVSYAVKTTSLRIVPRRPTTMAIKVASPTATLANSVLATIVTVTMARPTVATMVTALERIGSMSRPRMENQPPRSSRVKPGTGVRCATMARANGPKPTLVSNME